MSRLTRLLVLLILLPLGPLLAEPRDYALDTSNSTVEFTYSLGGTPGTGTMPVVRADLRLDFDRVANSRAVVELDAARSRTNVGFVTQALKSPQVLDTARFPIIRFVSRRVTALTGGARITGDVTLRGVTRPLVLDAQIYRQRGTGAGDLSRLSVLLTGQIRRSDFGASGYSDLVGDVVGLRILARIEAP
ncbi:YceI family protein [Fluviibacterium sp. DFM31]|uniref:YceI family protein n=1 Tax=Meridianimarinicoccus marinus TaxID=3231483 RepID=A0ABV3L1T5_9RHOB